MPRIKVTNKPTAVIFLFPFLLDICATIKVKLLITIINVDKLKIDNRIRLEKRFFHNAITDVNTNDERYRFRTALTLPLNSEKMASKTIFVNAFDELFIGPNGDLFKRNRIFGGVGYVLNSSISTNLGYMWQRELNPNLRSLHFLYLAFNFTLDRAKLGHHEPYNVAD
jgi:hypothetical protein